jgi:hypothetical protein
VAGSDEEKAACESEPKGHKNQAENKGKDLGASGWWGHSGIIELLSMGADPDSNILITPVTASHVVSDREFNTVSSETRTVTRSGQSGSSASSQSAVANAKDELKKKKNRQPMT